jgi:DNA topoisomerase-6 subunit B
MPKRKPKEPRAQLEVMFTPNGDAAQPVPQDVRPLREQVSAAHRTTRPVNRKSRPRRSTRPSKPRSAASGAVEPAAESDIAYFLAARQREISISEFFAKTRHALDACEESGILPDIRVQVIQLSEDRFEVIVEDNGPGIVSQQVPKVFGKLLYGSRFHTLKQARGQQGIGISAAGMYGLLTTGKPVRVLTRIGPRRPAHEIEVAINTKKNAPEILLDRETEWDRPHGTRVAITLQGTYKKGSHSIDDYLRQVAVANPHANIVYEPPKDGDGNGPVVYGRMTNQRPREPKEIRPHPHGVELGVFLKMLQDTSAKNLRTFLQTEFSRVGGKVFEDTMAELHAEAPHITPRTPPQRIARHDAEVLHTALGRVKIMAPPTDCLSPIGEELLLRALKSRVEADFYTTVTRSPAVYRGNPFQIEVGLAYGGGLPGDELAELFRYANRVPLQYQRSACAINRAVSELPWRNYKVAQSRGALPTAPMILVVHVVSVWVPFTSESKEAIAHYPEILHEIRLALQECGRRLAAHVSRHRRVAEEQKKRSYIQKYIPQIGIALQEILGLTDAQRERTITALTEVLEKSRRA